MGVTVGSNIRSAEGASQSEHRSWQGFEGIVGVKSQLRSMTDFLANKRRKLEQTPVNPN
jgi:hypothetical protein